MCQAHDTPTQGSQPRQDGPEHARGTHIPRPAQPIASSRPGAARGPRTAAAAHPLGDELLAAARTALHPAAGVLLSGPAGIGKTALLDALGHEAGSAGTRVLRCAPGPADIALPHAALIELLLPVPDREHTGLPEHQRTVLRAALLRGSRPGDRLDRLALRLAVTATLERLAQDTPLLLLLDGVERIDPLSAEVLAHVVRQAPGLGVAVAAARRTGPGPLGAGPDPAGPRLWPRQAVQLTVPPLPDEAVGELLARAGRVPGPARLRRVLRLAAGNPLYARELAAEPARRGPGRPAGPAIPPRARIRPGPPTCRCRPSCARWCCNRPRSCRPPPAPRCCWPPPPPGPAWACCARPGSPTRSPTSARPSGAAWSRSPPTAHCCWRTRCWPPRCAPTGDRRPAGRARGPGPGRHRTRRADQAPGARPPLRGPAGGRGAGRGGGHRPQPGLRRHRLRTGRARRRPHPGGARR
ncbi:AAA family ATPase [Streptacidiphilus sp. 4-A2]|nr:AAA family ATPase [Streptacidiphilus sp. 4-A2]